jgi:hypothetical protein
LRVGPKDIPEVVTSKILAASKAFQEGKWALLISKASPSPRHFTRTSPPPQMDLEDKVSLTQKYIQVGSLRQARTLLASNGFASGDTQEITDDLRARHQHTKTQAVPPPNSSLGHEPFSFADKISSRFFIPLHCKKLVISGAGGSENISCCF